MRVKFRTANKFKVDAVYNRRSIPICNGDFKAANQFCNGCDI